MTKEEAAPLLEELRREYGQAAERSASVSAIAGEQVDRDLAVDYWSFGAADLENELWSRLPELEAGLDILPQADGPAAPGLAGRLRGLGRRLLLRLAMPLIHRSLEKQDRFNRRAVGMHFIQFLASKRLRGQVAALEAEACELRGRLDALEAARDPREAVGHE